MRVYKLSVGFFSSGFFVARKSVNNGRSAELFKAPPRFFPEGNALVLVRSKGKLSRRAF